MKQLKEQIDLAQLLNYLSKLERVATVTNKLLGTIDELKTKRHDKKDLLLAECIILTIKEILED